MWPRQSVPALRNLLPNSGSFSATAQNRAAEAYGRLALDRNIPPLTAWRMDRGHRVRVLDGLDPQVHEDGLRLLLHDPAAAAELSASGLETIHARHTCAHRANALLTIRESIAGRALGR